MSKFEKLRNRIRRDGLRTTAGLVWVRVRQLLIQREQQVWYRCDLTGERPRCELADGLRFIHSDGPELDAVALLGQSVREAKQCRAGGNDVWLVLENDDPLFACRTFRHATPMIAQPNGVLKLPSGVACLEYSVTASAARGRGIAPGAWTLIADRLADEGFSVMITPVRTDNIPSRRAVEKVGFREVAVMDHWRIGPRRRTSVQPFDDQLGQELAARLSGRATGSRSFVKWTSTSADWG